MTLAHYVYIPIVLAVGIYLGFAMGSRSVRKAWEAEEKRRRREEEAV